MIGLVSLVSLLYANATTVAALLTLLQIVVTIIVNTTATPKDDEVWGRIYKGLEIASGIITKKAKQ